jgi:hypothetical protein
VKKPVSKFAFQMQNLQRYNPARSAPPVNVLVAAPTVRIAVYAFLRTVVGRCTLESS